MTRRRRRAVISVRVARNGALIPVDAASEVILKALTPGAEICIDIREKRSLKAERLYWAILNKIVSNTEFATAEDLSNRLKIRCGLVDAVSIIGGTRLEPHARSLSDLGASEMSAFLNAAIQVLSTEVVPGLDIDAVIESIYERN